MSHTPLLSAPAAPEDVFAGPSMQPAGTPFGLYQGPTGSLQPDPTTPTPASSAIPPDTTVPQFRSSEEASAFWKAEAEKEIAAERARHRAEVQGLQQNFYEAIQGRPLPRYGHSTVGEPSYGQYRQPKPSPPDKFNGRQKSTTLVTNWLFATEQWYRVNNYNPKGWVRTVSTYLTEYAQTWYRKRPYLGDYGAPWTDFAAAMHTEYDDELL